MRARYESVSRTGALRRMSQTYMRREDYLRISMVQMRWAEVYTMPSLSLLIPWSKIFSLVASSPPKMSPSGGPSLISRSRESISAVDFLTAIGRLPAAPRFGGVMFVASLFDLPRLGASFFAGERFL
jgi:hypothetical protein